MAMPAIHFSFHVLPGQHSRPVLRSKILPIRCSEDRQALFSRIAPVYDNLNDLLSLGQHRIWKRMAVSWSRKGETMYWMCVVEVEIWLFFYLRKLVPNGKVVGLDFSKEQLCVASRRQHFQSKPHYENIKWVEGTALDLPFPEFHFDAVTIGYGLRNLVDRRKALEEVCRVLKPGSRVSVLDFNKSTNPFSSSIQERMIDYIVVPVADSYGLANEYKYLKGSIKEYLTGRELEKLALEAGFSMANHYEIGGGLMGNLVATR